MKRYSLLLILGALFMVWEMTLGPLGRPVTSFLMMRNRLRLRLWKVPVSKLPH